MESNVQASKATVDYLLVAEKAHWIKAREDLIEAKGKGKMHSERIYATYFQGDQHVPDDTEARDMWLKYLPADRVIGCDAQDNFWEVRTHSVVVSSLWMDGCMHACIRYVTLV
jgi:hypothetical protein